MAGFRDQVLDHVASKMDKFPRVVSMRRKTRVDNVTIWERVGFIDDLALLRQIVPEDRIKVKIGERTWCQMTGQLPPVDRSKNWRCCGYPVELLSDPLDYFGAAISE